MATGLGISNPNSRHSTGNSSKFQLPSSSPSSTTSQDPNDEDTFDPDAPLPFPTALSRNDFLAPDFNAATYLSSLFPGDSDSSSLVSHRHQTLEDLRAELRERSSAISAELLELVNANYTSFLGLGDELKGGEERVEDVRVALLGFRRQVEEVQSRVRGRREDVQRTGSELRTVRGEVEQGRKMLELDERCEVLLGQLEDGRTEDEEEDEDDDYEEERLAGLAREYNAIERLADAIGRELPYVRKIDERIMRCRNTLLLDLGTATKEARKAGEKDRVVRLLGIYRQLDASAEGVKMLKEK
ncbi:Conserved oligomeric Golgi complex subunit 2 [Cytospora mali]|uniref:Conserved oligomeric Golgi complex subunit 2 n=1 Tax=Cytospora mali TaxID=578113 RepID=A0A194UM55_CYTMA|nr:Conserved oligomeric Golgi complex subunit 2 [Valsa mali var. pyri (nom. inval.)]